MMELGGQRALGFLLHKAECYVHKNRGYQIFCLILPSFVVRRNYT